MAANVADEVANLKCMYMNSMEDPTLLGLMYMQWTTPMANPPTARRQTATK